MPTKRADLDKPFAKQRDNDSKTIYYKESELKNFKLLGQDAFHPIAMCKSTNELFYVVKGSRFE